MVTEEIKRVRGWPGYTISNKGKLYKDGIRVKTFRHKNYERCKIYKIEGDIKIRKNVKIHRLVAEAFLPNPNNLPIVMHLDDDTYHNKSTNLKWGTQKENVHDAISKGRLKLDGKNNPSYGLVGEKNPNSKLTDKQVTKIINSTESDEYLANKYFVSKGHISNLRRKAKRNINWI